jgi:hypothetical protein
MIQRRQKRQAQKTNSSAARRLAAQGEVLSRLPRSGELDGLSSRQEAARILGESIDASSKGQLAARKVN